MKMHMPSLMLACIATVALATGPAAAAEPLPRDPYLPPAARQPSPPTSGQALKAKVAQKLARRFDAADVARTGTLTQEQAKSAGWGYVSEHFDAIDTAHNGRVTLEDIRRYMRARGAQM